MIEVYIPDCVPHNDGYFGWCPDCFKAGIHRVTVGIVRNTSHGDHWMTCEIHKTKWCLGNNLFSGWRDMSEKDLIDDEKILNQCQAVEPIDS